MSLRPPILGGLMVLAALMGRSAPAQDHNAQAIEPPAQTPADEIAYYRKAFSRPYDNWWLVRQDLSPDIFCARFYPDPEQRRDAFDKFVQDLIKDPATRITGLLEKAEWGDPANVDAAIHAFAVEMWNERDQLIDNEFNVPLTAAFQLEIDRGEKVADPELIALLHFELQRVTGFSPETASTWHPELFPPGDRSSLWNDLLAAHARSASHIGADEEAYFALMQRQFITCYGNPDESAPAALLVVNRFWRPTGADASPTFELDARTMTPVADGLWVTGDDGNRDPTKYGLYHVVIDPTQAEAFTTGPAIAPPVVPSGLVATPDALFLLGEPNGQWDKSVVARYDLLSQNWVQHDAPNSSNIYMAAGHVYLALTGGSPGPGAKSGIALYDDQTGDSTILASSSRQPAQNQFDARDYYGIHGIFAGPKNQPCVTVGFGETYIIQSESGPWPKLIHSGQLDMMQTDGTRTLLFGPRSIGTKLGDVVFMIDPTMPGPELWLGAPAPSYGTEMQGVSHPPPQPPWPRNPIWPTPASGAINSSSYGFRGNDLFGLSIDQATARNELVWYKRGQAAPFHILLDFKNVGADGTGNGYAGSHLAPLGSATRIVVVPTGICFPVSDGFYFLPFADIDAYIHALPNNSARVEAPFAAP